MGKYGVLRYVSVKMLDKAEVIICVWLLSRMVYTYQQIGKVSIEW